MGRKRFLVVAACAATLVAVGAGGAYAGEVRGPPTSIHEPGAGPPSGGTPNTNSTGATLHANSLCVFSGLNDFIEGPTERQTQTPKDFAPGDAGHGNEIFPDGCVGGSL
jgi:hypothetical protein